MNALVANAFAQGSELLDDGGGGQDSFNYILPALCRGVRKASPTAVMQTFQILVSLEGDTISHILRRAAVVSV